MTINGEDADAYVSYDDSQVGTLRTGCKFSTVPQQPDPAEDEVVPPTARDLQYTGSSQKLVNYGQSSFGTMLYALGTSSQAPAKFTGEGEDTVSNYSSSSPEGEEVGTYYVWYYVSGDDHDDTEPALLTVTIKKAAQAEPSAAEAASVSRNTVSLKPQEGQSRTLYGYSTNPNAGPSDIRTWQASPDFTGLASGRTYYFFVKFEGDGHFNEAVTETGTPVRTETVPGQDTRPEAPAGDSGKPETPVSHEDSGRFVDVDDSDYYSDPVNWADEKGITNGIDPTHFDPSGYTTRAQLVTFLWRASGCPEPAAEHCDFTDVQKGSYYEKAVIWAVEQGITKGTSSTTFSPDERVTRAQTVTFLARLAGVKDDDTGYAHPFKDVKPADYFSNAVAWAAEKKITEGTAPDTFSPDAFCLRGQIVTFLYRYFELQDARA